jgi:hypothetical protein
MSFSTVFSALAADFKKAEADVGISGLNLATALSSLLAEVKSVAVSATNASAVEAAVNPAIAALMAMLSADIPDAAILADLESFITARVDTVIAAAFTAPISPPAAPAN